MATNYTPHEYQARAIEAVKDNTHYALFLGCGLGKSVIALTAASELQDSLDINRVLVIAPKKVAESTWSAEAAKWRHTEHLRVAKILGTPAQRIRAIQSTSDIYVINRENVKWLVDYLHEIGDPLYFDMCIIDELSSFKSHSAQRFKALRMLPFRRIVGLTGTPMSNGYMDLWAQMYLLDKGLRLGKNITRYRNTFFTAAWSNGNIVYKYNLRPGADKEIQSRISDICLSMNAEDYLQLPERIDEVVPVELDTPTLKRYRKFEKEAVMESLGDGTELTAANAAALAGKLCQFANGAIYDDERNVHFQHNSKIEMLQEIVERSSGENILVAYNFKHDLSRIQEAFPNARTHDGDDEVQAWNRGEIPMLLAHPASAGYGLNLQAGGAIIVWFGLNWSLELYEQFNARLHRQGQTKTVRVLHLVSVGTFDERIMSALQSKGATQKSLLDSLRDLI